MKLYEFFGHYEMSMSQESDEPKSLSKEEEETMTDQIFWYILDDDALHKKYFMPAAKKLKKIYDSESKEDDKHDWKTWIPMVNRGCVKYYKENNLSGNPEKIFHKKIRKDLCKRLVDHYDEDIKNNKYNLGV